jgi:hypothetical protein
MSLEKLALRELLSTVRMVADPDRSMDFELVSEPKSTLREARTSLEAAFESAEVWAQVLHYMFSMLNIRFFFNKMSGTLASMLSWCECLVRIYSSMDIRSSFLRNTRPAVWGPE